MTAYKLICRALQRFAGDRPARRIDSDGQDYMFRVYLWHWRGYRVYLHKFVAGDGDRWLHDHPFTGLAVILAGEYDERRLHRFDCPELIARVMRRRWFNLVRGNDFHQISSIRRETWTLFIHGPHRKRWGFLQAVDGMAVYHNPFDQGDSNGSHWWLNAPTLNQLESTHEHDV